MLTSIGVFLRGMKVLIISDSPRTSLPWPNQLPPAGVELLWSASFQAQQASGCTAVFDFTVDGQTTLPECYANWTGPVFLGSVLHTLEQLQTGQRPIARFNHWMLQAGATELELAFPSVAGTQMQKVLEQLQLTFRAVPDIPGFVSTRIVSLIINEAFLALEEGVTGREEIDTAMKLGTNYPKGPFEWFAALGPQRVANLLQQLSATHQRYTPASLLLQTAQHGLPAQH